VSAAGALVGAAACLLATPQLARLTCTVPDRDERRWWRGGPASPPRYAATALTALALGGLAGAAAGISAVLPALVALALFATPLVVIDYEHHRLPNRLVLPAAVAAALLLTLAAAGTGDWQRLLRALEGAVAVYAVLYALAWISPRSFGAGDVRLGGVLGGYLGWFGWGYVYYGIFAGFVLGSLVGIALVLTHRGGMKTAIAFGPMLVLGALLVLAFDLVPGLG
jgi:leader peptidase (prepilin peptidase)/N-methyltransferase